MKQYKHANLRMASSIADAAKVGRLTADWSTQIVHVDDLINRNLKAIKARCRDAYINNPMIKRYVGLLERNVIGDKGIQLQMQIVDADGKTPDTLANESVEKSFKDWGKRKNCEVTGRYSWLSLQVAWIRSLAIDGEFLARKIRGEGKHGFQWQILDTELLDLNHNERSKGGNFIRFGIEFTDYGKPVAYFILNRDPFSAADHVFNGQKYTRVLAEDIFHDFVPLFAGQKRGFPMPHASLYSLHQLKGYGEAALVAARMGAIQGGFFTKSAEYDEEDEGVYKSTQERDEGGAPIASIDEGVIPVDMEPGELTELPRGVSFEAFNPAYPHSQFGEFTKAHKQDVASGLDNVSYHTLANDLEGVSFSSIRTGTLEDRESWKLLQSHCSDGFCEQTFEEWLPYSMLMGQVAVENKIVPFDRLDKFNQPTWQPRRWPWVDPLKDAKAWELAEKMKWTSPQRVIRARGDDPEEIAKEIEQWKIRFPDEVETEEVKPNA